MNDELRIYAPAFAIRLEGAAAPVAFMESLAGWHVSQGLSRPATCKLSLYEPDPDAMKELRLGSALELEDNEARTVFAGIITSLRREKRADGMRAVHVGAHDGLDRLRRRQSTALHRPDLLADVVTAAVADSGLDVAAQDPGPELPLMLQWGTTDLDWLASLCATYGFYFTLEGDTVSLMSLEGTASPAIELDPVENLFELAIESDTVMLRTSANACAWNPLSIESYVATAMDLTLEGVTGWDGLPPELTETDRDIVGGAGAQNENTLSRVAAADLERATKHAHRFTGLAEGDARLRPGSRIVLKRVDDGFDGEFVLTGVEHAYSPESGYTSALTSAPPRAPERLSGPAISLGVVSDSNDPASAGRVKVLLKAFNDVESDWLSVCSLGAGESKGLVLQPEVGDSVLIAFVNDNPAQGVVIGGLFGANALHDEDVGSQRPRPASLRTRDGQLLRLDDQRGAVRVQSRGGVFNLDPAGVVLEARADLKISAPGRRITIVADRVDFRKG